MKWDAAHSTLNTRGWRDSLVSKVFGMQYEDLSSDPQHQVKKKKHKHKKKNKKTSAQHRSVVLGRQNHKDLWNLLAS